MSMDIPAKQVDKLADKLVRITVHLGSLFGTHPHPADVSDDQRLSAIADGISSLHTWTRPR